MRNFYLFKAAKQGGEGQKAFKAGCIKRYEKPAIFLKFIIDTGFWLVYP